LHNYTSLIELTLNLDTVTNIGNHFLSNCTSLEKLTLTLDTVTNIGNDFLSNCTSLKELTLNLNSVTNIGNYFLLNCTSLIKLTLTLDTVTNIGDNFLSSCTSLENLDLLLPKVTKIGDSFLLFLKKLSNPSIQKIVSSLTNVTSIGKNFMSLSWLEDEDTDLLEKIDLSSLKNIQNIGKEFFLRRKKLKDITITELPTDKLFILLNKIDFASTEIHLKIDDKIKLNRQIKQKFDKFVNSKSKLIINGKEYKPGFWFW
jgi:division protein CdvB (Snf7/Vps24/ESCRT-III family)